MENQVMPANIPPKVSICVPVYGVEKYIGRCAETLFKQTYDNIEYIFVNDCTPDESMSILENILKLYPERKKQVRIINHKSNLKLGNARNTAVSAATGDFIIHVDSDDYIDLNLVEKCVKLQKKTQADIIYFDGIQYTNKSNGLISRPRYNTQESLLLNTLSRRIPVSIWGLMIRRSLYVDNNIQVEGNINCSEDFIVTSRLFYFTHNIAKLDNVFYHYDCTNEGSITAKKSLSSIRDNIKVLDFIADFYKDKEDKYQIAVLEGSIDLNIDNLCASVRLKDRELFDDIKQRLRFASNSIGIMIPPRFARILKMNLFMAKIYVTLGFGVNAIIRNIRYFLHSSYIISVKNDKN